MLTAIIGGLLMLIFIVDMVFMFGMLIKGTIKEVNDHDLVNRCKKASKRLWKGEK